MSTSSARRIPHQRTAEVEPELVSHASVTPPWITVFLWVLLFGLPFAFLLFPSYENVTQWLGFAIIGLFAVTGHFFAVRKHYPPILHVAILVAFIQLVFVAWMSRYVSSLGNADLRFWLPSYLGYSIPFTLAFAAGCLFALQGFTRPTEVATETNREENAEVAKWFDYLVWGGIVATVLNGIIYFPPLAFFLYLLTNIKFVGGFGLFILNDRRANSRLFILFTLELAHSAGSAFFHSLALWSACFLAFWFYHRRPNVIIVSAVLIAGLIGVTGMENAKLGLRQDLRERILAARYDREFEEPSPIDKMLSFAEYGADGVMMILTLDVDEGFRRHLVNRYNQGWIVNRVMRHVPIFEPYAEGETIQRALSSAFLPRFLAPDKYRAGGRDYMERFAGYRLQQGTSMNIGLAGEFYANFGRWGGVTMAFAHGLMLGLIFRGIGILARRQIAFWAFAPFILHLSIKSEDGYGEILNWISKAGIVSAMMIFVIPPLRRAILPSRPSSTTAPTSS